jgi:hypothetical protein
MVFVPSYPTIDKSLFERKDWTTTEASLDEKEELPANMPQPRGMGCIMRAFADADHATDSITRRPKTGFLVYLNSALITWICKQTSTKTSSFSSKFWAMKQCTEYVQGLHYKLRMLGIPCEGPTYIFGDNQSVLFNTSIPDSTIKKKKPQSIAHHFVREGAAHDEWRTTYVNAHLNPADLMTKPLPSREKLMGFVMMLLHHPFARPVD